MKIVVNRCWGGFGLSVAAKLWLINKGSDLVTKTPVAEYYGFDQPKWKDEKKEWESEWSKREVLSADLGLYFVEKFTVGFITDGEFIFDVDRGSDVLFRSHKDLVECVEKLGVAANGIFASLKVLEIPDDAKDVRIEDYDGMESVAEGRMWV